MRTKNNTHGSMGFFWGTESCHTVWFDLTHESAAMPPSRPLCERFPLWQFNRLRAARVGATDTKGHHVCIAVASVERNRT